jgi:hypothetical protein
MSHNGWKNYETWNVKLWIDNDQGSHEHWQSRAEQLVKDETEEDRTDEEIRDAASDKLAAELKSSHEEGMPEVQGTYSDLLTAALGEVDWNEIAENMVSDIQIDRD